jgi:hypothetical protein
MLARSRGSLTGPGRAKPAHPPSLACGSLRAPLANLLFGALLAGVLPAGTARAEAVGLGVGAGIALPSSSLQNLSFDPAFNWGFYTDIPLISSFHISPSALVYKLSPSNSGAGSTYATDMTLSFKFMITTPFVEPFFGLSAGLTASNTSDPHVGLLGGVSFHLIANLEAFAQATYRIVLRDQMNGGNVHDIQLFAGPLFRFAY